MSKHEHYEHGRGPIYSVPLIDSLPLNPDNPSGMLQQMPSAADLDGILNYRQGGRVCAGYEMLLHHWRLQQAQIDRLRGAIRDVISGHWSLSQLQDIYGTLRSEREDNR